VTVPKALWLNPTDQSNTQRKSQMVVPSTIELKTTFTSKHEQ